MYQKLHSLRVELESHWRTTEKESEHSSNRVYRNKLRNITEKNIAFRVGDVNDFLELLTEAIKEGKVCWVLNSQSRH